MNTFDERVFLNGVLSLKIVLVHCIKFRIYLQSLEKATIYPKSYQSVAGFFT